MRRELAFEVAREVTDLGVDCTVSIAAAHPAEGIAETAIVHIAATIASSRALTRLIEIAAGRQLDLHMGGGDIRIVDLGVPVSEMSV